MLQELSEQRAQLGVPPRCVPLVRPPLPSHCLPRAHRPPPCPPQLRQGGRGLALLPDAQAALGAEDHQQLPHRRRRHLRHGHRSPRGSRLRPLPLLCPHLPRRPACKRPAEAVPQRLRVQPSLPRLALEDTRAPPELYPSPARTPPEPRPSPTAAPDSPTGLVASFSTRTTPRSPRPSSPVPPGTLRRSCGPSASARAGG